MKQFTSCIGGVGFRMEGSSILVSYIIIKTYKMMEWLRKSVKYIINGERFKIILKCIS